MVLRESMKPIVNDRRQLDRQPKSDRPDQDGQNRERAGVARQSRHGMDVDVESGSAVFFGLSTEAGNIVQMFYYGVVDE